MILKAIPHIIDIVQGIFIGLVGLVASSITWNYEEDLEKIAITVISMALGTIVSFFVKKLLNRKKHRNGTKQNDSNK